MCMPIFQTAAGMLLFDDRPCAAVGAKPLSVEPCDATPCPELFWDVTYSPVGWSSCSSPCYQLSADGSAIASTLGVSSINASVTCKSTLANGTVVRTLAQACTVVGLPRPVPVTTRPCNRFVCPAAVVMWEEGPWSGCVSTTSSAVPSVNCVFAGNMTRTVRCVSAATGAEVDAAACVEGSSSQRQPPSSQSCFVLTQGSVDGRCGCTTASDCGSPNSVCSSGVCACADGWTGVQCDIVSLLATSADAGASGCVVDAAGTCCSGPIDVDTELCCGSSLTRGAIITDSVGQCCPSGVIDACGICNGDGVVVDSMGVCCSTPLPPSGLCCINATIDACGVCKSEECVAVQLDFVDHAVVFSVPT